MLLPQPVDVVVEDSVDVDAAVAVEEAVVAADSEAVPPACSVPWPSGPPREPSASSTC